MDTSKVIVITGASDGTGAAAARALGKIGHQVVLVGRSPDKTHRIATELRVDSHITDSADLDAVRALAATLQAKYPRIDVLANNAGGVFGKSRTLTSDGHEITFQVNYLAPSGSPETGADMLVYSAQGTPGADFPCGEYVVKRKVARANKQAYGADLAAQLQAKSISRSISMSTES